MKKYIILLTILLVNISIANISIANGYNECTKEKEKALNIYKMQVFLDEQKSGLYKKYKLKNTNADKIDILNNSSYKEEMNNIENKIEKVEKIYSKYKDEYEKCKLSYKKNTSNSIKNNNKIIKNNNKISGYNPTLKDKKLLLKIEKLINKKLSKSPKKLNILLSKIDKILVKANKNTKTYYLLSEIKKIIVSNNNYKIIKSKIIEESFNKAKIKYLELNKNYIAKDGLTVKIKNVKIIKEKGYDLYKIDYVLTNNTKDKKITEGTFKAFYKNKSDGLPQYGFFNSLFPGESINRSYSFKTLKNDKFGYFAYGKLFSSKNPKSDSLVWKFNY